MRRSLLAAGLAVPLLVQAPVAHAEELLLSRLADYLESLRIQARIPGLAAAIIGSNDILWDRAFGRQDLDRALVTRTDTPFHLDGLTQVVTASLVLRCVEEGRLSLDQHVGEFRPDSLDASSTVRQILTHTSMVADELVFAYRPDRLEPLALAVERCLKEPFRVLVAKLLDRLAMIDSVPGADVIGLPVPLDGGFPSASAIERYASVLERLATPYAVDQRGRASVSRYLASTLTPAGGLISTVRDFARFDLALKTGLLLRPDTVAASWQPPLGRDGQPLPHAIGWFVQLYNGEVVVWQYGVSDTASSSLVIMVPARGLTLVLLANSGGLVKPHAFSAGDLTVSPFARVFLALFVR